MSNINKGKSYYFCNSVILLGVLVVFLLIPIKKSYPYEEINCSVVLNDRTLIDSQANPKEKLKKGYCFLQTGNYLEGLSQLNGLENILITLNDYILFYQAIAHKNLGNLPAAISTLNQILAMNPSGGLRLKTQSELGELYNNSGDFQNAEKIYTQLYLEEPDNSHRAEYKFKLADTQMKQSKFTQAIESYKKVWLYYPQSEYSSMAFKEIVSLSRQNGIPFKPTPSDYQNRAEILYDSSRWGEALGNFNKVPKNDVINIKIAICKFRLGRLGEAYGILSSINTPSSLFWRAKIDAKRDLDAKASESYLQLAALYPNSGLAPEALYNAARLYQINDDTQKAVKIYDSLLRKYSKSEFAEDGAWNLGWIYYRRGMFREAQATFSAFTNAQSTFNASNSKYWKARTLEKQGRNDEAKEIYKNLAMSMVPTYHSYLAQKKTGLYPTYTKTDPEVYFSFNGYNPLKDKIDLLIEIGLFDDAIFEIDKLQNSASSANDFILISLLYSKVNDFYKSIKNAQGIGLPAANTLSFPLGYRVIVEAYSKKYGIDEYLVYSIIREESRFQKNARSPANARGLMQLLPSTGRATARKVGLSSYNTEMLNIPRINIELGIYYFKQVLDEFLGDIHLAMASYNAGPHRAAKWKVKHYNLDKDEFVEEIPFRETRNYIRRILRSYGAYKAIYGNESSDGVEKINTNTQ